MKIIIDEKHIKIFPEDKNIVDVADREKICIPAPCYRTNRSKGCCKVCVVEINGKNEYACATKPVDGANIIVNREDLSKIRKERMKKYQEALKDTPKNCGCNCSGTTNDCG
jgi:NADH dehydrogenase/NADH:ubiquinone oxidoreductase subunit G